MQLPSFIDRALAFFSKAEANMTAEEKLTKMQARITELEGQAAKDKETISVRDATIQELAGKLEKAQSEVNAKGQEIAKLLADLEAEKKRTDETLAAMGVNPKSIPAKQPEASAKGKGIIAEYEAITDSAERVAFYRKHKNDIDAAWGKE